MDGLFLRREKKLQKTRYCLTFNIKTYIINYNML